MYLYKDELLAIYVKQIGEDSEKLDLPAELDGYRAVSRLDKPVGGVLMLASSKGFNKLQNAEIKKEYIAIVAGRMEADTGVYKDFLYHDKRNNKTYPVKKMRNGVKEAILNYEVVDYNNELDISLVRIRLETGRTHQIRVQFASRKHPLYGDGKYGSRFKGFPALFCSSIEFMHPIKNTPLTFTIKPEGNPWDNFNY